MTAPPSDAPRSDTAEIVRAVVAAVVELLRGVRHEIERLRDGAEAFLGRVQMAFVRSLAALQKALVATALAFIFLVAGVIVLVMFLIAFLNEIIGAPWGTGVAALLFVAIAAVFWLRARSHFHTMEVEAALLAGRGDGRSRRP